MRILEIREKTFPIASPIRNAYIDFSKMTLSLVAVITDVVRDVERVENGYVAMPDLVGIGFEGKSDLCRVMRELSA